MMMDKMAPSFEHPLNLKLELESDGKKTELLAGNIENLFLELHSYGFEAYLILSGCDNKELADLFDSKKPTSITLTFLPTDPLQTDPLLELKGFVVPPKEHQKVDVVSNNSEKSVIYYKIVVHDNARATWQEHFPTSIYIDKSMKDALEEHKNPEITLKYDFPPIEAQKPITAFSLPFNKSIPKTDQPSFYSFVHWYLQQAGGIFAYDYKAHSYSIIAKKEAKGEAYKIAEAWVTPPIGAYPTIPRYNTKVVTHTAQSSDPEDKENEEGYKSVRRDFMSSKGYTVFPEHAHEDVASSLYPTDKELTFHALSFEEDFHLDKLIPGSLVGFPMDPRSWTKDHQDKVYRSRSMVFTATKIDPPDTDKPIQKYLLSCTTLAELKDETYIERPHYHPPVFPFQIHGKIFSDIGDEKQSTFKVTKGEKDPLGQYHVQVPLAGKDHTLVIPFLPNMTGHYYFPYTKDQEVLLAMYFHTAQILRAIEHQNRVRLPDGAQGKQIVLSYNNTNEYAIFKHEFKDGKQSVITIEQATSDKQMQVFTIQDKEILITVNTKDEKSIFIKWSSETGLLLTVDDQQGKISQTIALDGKQIVQTCKNDSDTCTIVQTPDSATVTCKNFTVKADKIVMDAKEEINCKAASKINLEAPVTNAKTKLKVG